MMKINIIINALQRNVVTDFRMGHYVIRSSAEY